jgi:hypothetical protein
MRTSEINEHDTAILRCALADLIGSWQAYTQLDHHAHDWRAHQLTINELATLLGEELPEGIQ